MKNRKLSSHLERQFFWKGVLDAVPIAVGYIPIATSFGALGVQSNLSTLACVAMSLSVFAGASQFVALGLIASGAGVSQIILGTFFLNLRHLVMSISLRNYFGEKSSIVHRISSLMITDETYALTVNSNNDNIYYFLGIGLCSYGSWILGTFLGGYFSQLIPDEIAASFSLALYALFIALAVPSIKRSNFSVIACVVSMGVSLSLYSWLGSGWSIITATITASVVTGIAVDADNRRQRQAKE